MSTPYDRPNESMPLTWPFVVSMGSSQGIPFVVSQGVPFVVSLSNHAFRAELSFLRRAQDDRNDRLRTNVALIE
jgi:hypothetical protein